LACARFLDRLSNIEAYFFSASDRHAENFLVALILIGARAWPQILNLRRFACGARIWESIALVSGSIFRIAPPIGTGDIERIA